MYKLIVTCVKREDTKNFTSCVFQGSLLILSRIHTNSAIFGCVGGAVGTRTALAVVPLQHYQSRAAIYAMLRVVVGQYHRFSRRCGASTSSSCRDITGSCHQRGFCLHRVGGYNTARSATGDERKCRSISTKVKSSGPFSRGGRRRCYCCLFRGVQFV